MQTISPTPDAIEAAWLAGKPVQLQYTRIDGSAKDVTLPHMISCELCDHPNTELPNIVALLRRLALAGDPEAMRIVRRMSHQIARSCGSDCDVPAKSEKHPEAFERTGADFFVEMDGITYPVNVTFDPEGCIDEWQVFSNGKPGADLHMKDAMVKHIEQDIYEQVRQQAEDARMYG